MKDFIRTLRSSLTFCTAAAALFVASHASAQVGRISVSATVVKTPDRMLARYDGDVPSMEVALRGGAAVALDPSQSEHRELYRRFAEDDYLGTIMRELIACGGGEIQLEGERLRYIARQGQEWIRYERGCRSGILTSSEPLPRRTPGPFLLDLLERCQATSRGTDGSMAAQAAGGKTGPPVTASWALSTIAE